MYHKLFLPLFLILVFACNEKNSVIDTEHIPEKTDRTILLYMAGENSLSSYCQPNIDSLLAGMERTKYK